MFLIIGDDSIGESFVGTVRGYLLYGGSRYSFASCLVGNGEI